MAEPKKIKMLSQEDKNEIRKLIATEIAKALASMKTKEPEKKAPKVIHRDISRAIGL
jgi:hypothetical protein